jgi:hypothetical protein
MSNEQVYEAYEPRYGAESFHTFERFKTAKRQRPTMGRQRGKTPQSFNGMHRRRKRKMAW